MEAKRKTQAHDALKWQLTNEAFTGWKQLFDAMKYARKSRDRIRIERLDKLIAMAWQRFVRRWRLAKSAD